MHFSKKTFQLTSITEKNKEFVITENIVNPIKSNIKFVFVQS